MTESQAKGLYISTWPVLKVHGPDAATWLNGIVTGNVLGATPLQACWTSLLSKQGKVQADIQLAGSADHLLLAVLGGESREVLETLDGYLVMEDAEIESSDLIAVVALGEEARDQLQGFGVELARLSWTDSEAWLGFVTPEQCADWREGLLLEEERFAAWCTAEGIPRFGVDYSARDNLHAAALERRTVDWSKGCYLGQEVVCMQDMRGKVKQRLVRLVGEELDSLQGESVLSADGAEVGTVTSATESRAIASVKAVAFEPGTALNVGGKRVVVASLR